MRVIIVGNGLAGTISAKTLRELDQKLEVDIFAEEKFHYYPRPNLLEFLAGSLPYERLFAFPDSWYREQKLSVHLETPVRKIFTETQEVEVQGGKREKYDYLLLANGSRAFLPPFKGIAKKGVFTLRTLDNALDILEGHKSRQRITVIGGGLLGLETARALNSRGAEVRVVEFFDRLLPRQLDSQSASLLKDRIEKMGIKVSLGLATEEILGEDEVRGVRFKGGQEIETDMAVVAAGVRPEVQIAKDAGLRTDRGIIVDDFLQSSQPNIFVAGDSVQHKDKVYGIIPASFNQARMAASNILGQRKAYEGTVLSNTLKVVGIDLTSIGTVVPEPGSAEEYREEERELGLYKKVVVQNGLVVGAIWLGTKKGLTDLNRIIFQKINVEKWKKSLLKDDFDFSVL